MENVTRLHDPELAIGLMSDMWCEPHVFDALDLRVKTFAGAHRLFSEIEKGEVWVYGSFVDDRLSGLVWGKVENGFFVTHVAFARGVDAAKICREVMELVKQDCHEKGIKLFGYEGNISEKNRAAIMMAKRCGFVDVGEDKFPFCRAYGVFETCRKMRKLIWNG